MKKRLIGILIVTGVTAWLGAQALAPSKPASELMPANALFYLEARNFAKVISDWDGSPEKAAWFASSNYQSFQRSHLLTRLSEARKGFTDAAGLPEDAPLLTGIAGGESALAFYDIGKLEFLYITQISSARFAESAIGKIKQKFQARKAGGRDYYVLSKGDNTVAFALVGDRLILATNEDLIAGSLELLTGQKTDSLRQAAWFTEALAKAPPGAPPDVRFVADLQKTARTPQFRSYWIQRNVSAVRQFATEVADLKFDTTNIREDRVFLRRKAKDNMADSEAAVADLLRYASADAGFYQASAKPAEDAVTALLAQKLFGHGQALERQNERQVAPDAPDGPSLAGEDDYETHVDVRQFAEDVTDAYAPLRALASNTDAVMQTAGARMTGVLPTIDTAVMLHGIAPWKAADVRQTLGQVAGPAWSVAPASLEWADRNGAIELNGVTPLRFAIDGNILVLSASPEFMARVISARKTQSSAGATYAASFRHAQEFPGFARIAHLLDFPSIPQGQRVNDAAREPLFFSENIASLATAMSRLDSVSITTHDTGALVSEAVVYRRK